MTHRVEGAELRQFIQRIEAQEARIAEEKDAHKDIYAELKARGYDAAIVRKLIAMRKKTPDQIAEEDAVLEMYKQAAGMA